GSGSRVSLREETENGPPGRGADPEIAVVQEVRRRRGPASGLRDLREDEREESDGRESPDREPARAGRAHRALPCRALTKATTARARSHGISRGFNIFSVRPGAR